MVAAIYGGFYIGLFAAFFSCTIVTFLWPLIADKPFIKDPADWTGLIVFLFNCAMMSGIAEAMIRANKRAKSAREQAEAAQEKAETANKAKSVFLASMSHELRTPLNAILGFSSIMLEEGQISDDQKMMLDMINKSGDHLLNLINDVLDMAKIEAGRTKIDYSNFDLVKMILDIKDLMRLRAEEKGLELIVDLSEQLQCFIKTDETKLRQIIINLVGNAVKFTKSGFVKISFNIKAADRPEAVFLIITVEDTGVGIDHCDQERIFNPFIQIGGQNEQKGSGLGLTITKKHAELLGGLISVESSPGKGSKFIVEIPISVISSPDIKPDANRGKIIGLMPEHPEYRILIVEDQIENRILLKRMLENIGFCVRVAENGEIGVDIFQKWRPQFIWMDIRMPVMDGLTATKLIRCAEGGKEVKIVALTASVFNEERSIIMEAGMDDFIRKPYKEKEIFDCIAHNLNLKFIYEKHQIN